MLPEEFSRRFPYLYHMAEADTWNRIKEHGLLSTRALLDLFQVSGHSRALIESNHRPESVEVKHPQFGSAIIRDQKPMSDAALFKCLTDMTPQQWYETLNGKVFFWLTTERLNTMLNARAYRDRKHCVITVDSAGILKRHIDGITLSPMNSGNTRPNPFPRGSGTFQPFSRYPFKDRHRRHLPIAVELAVEYKVPNLEKHTIQVIHMKGSKVLEVIYRV